MASINEIILRITADDDDASGKLEKLAALLDAVGSMDVDADVDVKTGGAEGSLASLAAQLKAFSGQEVKAQVDIDDSAAITRLAGLTTAINSVGDIKIETDTSDALRKIAELDAAAKAVRDVHVQADLDEGAALARLTFLAAAITAVDAKDINIDVETDANTVRNLTRLGGVLGTLTQIGNATASTLAGVGGSIGGLAVNIGPFTTALNPATAAVIALVFAIGTLLVGALAAVVASAAAAAAAVAALATAFIAALGPAVLVAISVVARLAKVLEALKASDAAAQETAQDAAANHERARRAEEARADAARQLQQAEEDLARATTQAYRDMADAAERARDAVLSLARARLSEERAALNIDRARLALKEFRQDLGLTGKDLDNTFKKFEDVEFDPKKLNDALRKVRPGKAISDEDELKLKGLVLDVKDARLAQKEATDGVGDATTALNRAIKDNNRYLQDGIKANPGYIAALRQRESAIRAVRRAERGDEDVTAAAAKAKAATQDLSGAELGLLAIIKEVRKSFRDIFSGASDAVIRGIITSIRRLSTVAAPLKGIFTTLGKAMSDALVIFVNMITTPQMIEAFTQLATLAGQLAGPIATALGAFFQILTNVAVAAGPKLLELFIGIADAFVKWASESENIKLMSDIMTVLFDNLDVWLFLAQQLARVLIAFFKDANGPGQELVMWVALGAKALADMMEDEEGRQKVRDWLKDAVDFAKDFFYFIYRLVVVMIRLGTIAYNIYNNIKKVVNAINGFLQSMERFFDSLDDKLLEFLDYLVHDFKNDVWNAAKSIGKSILQGIADGLSFANLRNVLKNAGGLAKRVLGAFGTVLKVGSPSKVMYDMGIDVVKGLELGIKGQGVSLAGVVDRTMVSPIVDISPVVPAGAISAPAGAGPSTIIEKQEVNLPAAPGGGLGDERAAAMMFARELRRRGH